MTPREIVLEQISHRSTSPVPYTVSFEGDVVGKRLDEHYGGREWRRRLTPYLVNSSAVETVHAQNISDTYTRDAYGILWRHDQPQVHLEPTFTVCSISGL